MSSGPPKTLVKSRKMLQAICKNSITTNIINEQLIKYEMFDRFLQILWNDIKKLITSTQLQHTNFIINLHKNPYSQLLYQGIFFTKAIQLELIEILKKEYPEVDFTYNETSGYDGKIIERIIIMDWS